MPNLETKRKTGEAKEKAQDVNLGGKIMSNEKHHMTVRELAFIIGAFMAACFVLSWILTAAGYLH